MHQLTIRGFDGELLRRLKVLADSEGLSMNQAALKLMRRGAGLERGGKSFAIGDAINKYAGVWTGDEAQEFDDAIRPFGQIDPDMWK